MGTLERFRKTSPYLLAAFAILFVGFMVASDADISNLLRQGSNYQTAILAKVNGEPIFYKDFENKVKDQLELRRQQAGDQELQIDDKQIRQSVWEQMVNDILLKQEAEKAGIFVSKEQLRDIMIDNPPENVKKAFMDSTGTFQRETYLELITNPDAIYSRLPNTMSQKEKDEVVQNWKNDLLKIEEDLRKQKLSESVTLLVNQAGSAISDNFVERRYIDDRSTADVSCIFLNARNIPDSTVQVSDADMQDYYEKVKKYHLQKDKRKIKYVSMPLIPSAKDSAAALKTIKRVQDDIMQAATKDARDSVFTSKMHDLRSNVHDFSSVVNIDQKILPYLENMQEKDVAGPVALPDGMYFFRLDGRRQGENELVKASHILVGFGTNKDSARAEVMKILAMAQAGEDFASLARKYSSDGSSQKGGDLGYFGKGKMVKPFEDATFAAAPGSIVGPVETQYGFHIIKVFDKKKEEMKYSEIIISTVISKNTEKDIKRIAAEIKKKIEEGNTIDTVARQYNLVAKESGYFEKNKPVLASSAISVKAFEGKIGEVLDYIDLKNYGITVVQITDEKKAGFTPLEELKTIIKRRVINIKKLDMLKQKAESIYASVKGLDSLSMYKGLDTNVAQYKFFPNIKNSGSIPGMGQDFAFTTKAVILPVGKISEPIRGELGYYIMQVTARTIADPKQNEKDYDDFLKTVLNRYKQSSYYQWFQKIKDEAEIEDFRGQFYRGDY